MVIVYLKRMNSGKIKDSWTPRNYTSKKIDILPKRWRRSNRMSMMQYDRDFPEDLSHRWSDFLTNHKLHILSTQLLKSVLFVKFISKVKFT